MDQNHQEVPYRGGAGVARGAHNSEDVGSNPTSGIIQFACALLCYRTIPQLHSWGVQKPAVIAQATLNLSIPHLLSSEAERRAHNPEVDRIKTIRRYQTGVAQG